MGNEAPKTPRRQSPPVITMAEAEEKNRADKVHTAAPKEGSAGQEGAEKKTGSKKHRKDKPWDHEGIDHWKIEPFNAGDMPSPLMEESSFATLFPKYREKYLREIWPLVTKELAKYGITCELNLREGSMTVKTTRKTWDPWAIMSARDFVKLLARSVPVQQAVKVFQDGTAADIIKIGNLVANKERFVKRRQRLVGPNGQTLKAIELLTGCYVLVQGNTVAAMGSHAGLKQVRKVVEDCMHNVHPVYNIKAMMIKRELQKDPNMANENWDRFLPKFKSRASKQKKKKPIEKKKRSLFPPEQTPRKVDIQMETGEFFMKEAEKKKIREYDSDRVELTLGKEKADRQVERIEQRKQEKEQLYTAPKEVKKAKKEKEVEEKDEQLLGAVAKLKAKGLAQQHSQALNRKTTTADFLLAGSKRGREDKGEEAEERASKRPRKANA